MTHSQRNEAIRDLLEAHTKKATSSKAAARDGLIAEGLYTKKGKLRVEYGGERKRAVSPA